ncbi:MAG TPA: hypothetical protein VFC78_20525 [Tepidisphaeraceae bacterium]|nr:hypothetical protein [Tepidisphaeraceae bacterium]
MRLTVAPEYKTRQRLSDAIRVAMRFIRKPTRQEHTLPRAKGAHIEGKLPPIEPSGNPGALICAMTHAKGIMKTWICAGLALALFGMTGCIVIPFPNRSTDAYGVRSKVIDAQTNAPIPKAHIYACDSRERAVSDDSGHFQLHPITRWHAGYLTGVLSYPIWPYTGDVPPRFERRFRIVAPGYEEQTFITDLNEHNRSGPSQVGHVYGSWSSRTLCVPEVRLKKSIGPPSVAP